MKKNYFVLLLLLYVFGANAQQQQVNMLHGGLQQLSKPKILQKADLAGLNLNNKLSTSKKSLVSNEFISKAMGCTDTLSYPYLKQQLDNDDNYFINPIDNINLTNPVYAQVYKTGTTPLQITGLEVVLGKVQADLNNAVSVKLSIYNLTAGGAPNTEIGSVNYLIPDVNLSVRYVSFPSPINVSGGFAVGISIITAGKEIQTLINDEAVNTTYDEELLYLKFGTNSFATLKSLYAGAGYNYDFDLIMHPIVSYNVDTPSLTATPTTACTNTPVNLVGTYTPTDAATNRFLNLYAFADYFNYTYTNETFVMLPQGVANTSIYNYSSNTSYTYTTAGSYTPIFQYTLGFQSEDCYSNISTNITINTPPNATFSYSGTNFCQSSSNATPTATTPGGTYSATPAGLSINTSTGVINFTASTIGNYVVTYNVTSGACQSSSTQNVAVTAAPNATFSYANTSYCSNGTNPQVVLGTGASAGTFSASPSGLSINASTGAINLSASTAGSYTVTNTIAAAGGCAADVKTFNVSVVAAPTASIAAIPAVCENAGSVTLSATPAGGTFSGTAVSGNSFDPAVAGTGTYTITYSVTQSGCTSTDSKQVVVGAPSNATFSYANTSYCSNGTDPQVVLGTGASAGTFSASPSGLSINSVTGTINLAASTAGSYTVTNTVAAAGGCAADVKTFNVSVVAAPTASIAAIPAVCENAGSVTLSATPAGGTFSGNAGVSGNSFDPAVVGAGTYTITYSVTQSGCTSTDSKQVVVGAPLNATFSYANTSYCSNGTDPQVVLSSGASAGTFSASPSGLSINSVTGTINLAASTAGSYTVTNTVAAAGGCAADVKTFNVSVVAVPTVTLDPIPSAVCQDAAVITLSATPAGGTFSGNAGVSGNSFDPSVLSAGTYTITYSVTQSGCTASDSKSVNVNAPLDATFSYVNTSYCSNGTDPQVVLSSGASAGTFSASPSGLSLNPVTGTINLAASTAGSYTVTNTVAAAGGCSGDVKTFNVDVVAVPTVTIDPIPSAICQDAGVVTLSATPAGGTFSGNAGVSGNSFDPSALSAGNYTITYSVTQSGCTASDSKSVTINTPLNATFSYANNSYCLDDPNPQVVLGTGASAGAFTASPSGLSINASTGAINLSASTAGNYTVTNTVAAAGGCPADVKTATITVDECLSVNEIESIKVQLFPVPAGNELNISVSEDVTAEVLTIEGKLALSPFNISKQSTYTLDTRPLAKGVYLLKLTTNTSELVRRIILE